MDCSCGNAVPFAECCEPLLTGVRSAETAEALMRARYSAYANGEIGFIERTHDPASSEKFDRESTLSWSKRSEWIGFEVLSLEGGGPEDDEGKVEFVARYRFQGQEHAHHETASFKRVDAQWFFIDGEMAGHETFRRATVKVGRNDPCSCGSGKKYKKCHGRAGLITPADQEEQG